MRAGVLNQLRRSLPTSRIFFRVVGLFALLVGISAIQAQDITERKFRPEDMTIQFKTLTADDGKYYTVCIISYQPGSTRNLFDPAAYYYSDIPSMRAETTDRARAAIEMMDRVHRWVIEQYKTAHPEILRNDPGFFDRMAIADAPRPGRDEWFVIFEGKDPEAIVASLRFNFKSEKHPQLTVEETLHETLPTQPEYVAKESSPTGRKTELEGEIAELKSFAVKPGLKIDFVPYLFLIARKSGIFHLRKVIRDIPESVAKLMPQRHYLENRFLTHFGKYRVSVSRFILKCATSMMGYYQEHLKFRTVLRADLAGLNNVLEGHSDAINQMIMSTMLDRRENTARLEYENGSIHSRTILDWMSKNWHGCKSLFQ